jgi:hypothetical protein
MTGYATRPEKPLLSSVSPLVCTTFSAMITRLSCLIVGIALIPATVYPQSTTRPFPPIDSVAGSVVVGVADFAQLPDIGDVPARVMHLVDEPGTRRFFVNDMRGPVYSVSYDGRSVLRYIDISDSVWTGVNVESRGRERGMQSFAFHPQFAQRGTPGYGKFYTWTDSRTSAATPDFRTPRDSGTHHTVLHEWTAKDAHGGKPTASYKWFPRPRRRTSVFEKVSVTLAMKFRHQLFSCQSKYRGGYKRASFEDIQSRTPSRPILILRPRSG